MFRGSSVLFVLATLAACKEPKGVEVDPRQLIPADAVAVFGFELDPLRNSPIGPVLHAAMQSDADMRAMLASVPSCNVDLANLRGVFAMDPDADDKLMAVVESPNIGDEDTVRCIDKEFTKATGGKEGILLFETKGDIRATPQEGGGYLIILNENAIAVVNKQWETTVFAAIDTPSSRDTTTPLAKSIEHVDPKTDMWFAMALSDSDRANFAEVEGADGLAVVSATADLSSGMKLDIGLDARDAANAKVLEGSISKMLAEVKPGLADAGMPPTLLDTLKVSTKDAHVSATFDLGKDVLPAVITAMAPLFAEG